MWNLHNLHVINTKTQQTKRKSKIYNTKLINHYLKPLHTNALKSHLNSEVVSPFNRAYRTYVLVIKVGMSSAKLVHGRNGVQLARPETVKDAQLKCQEEGLTKMPITSTGCLSWCGIQYKSHAVILLCVCQLLELRFVTKDRTAQRLFPLVNIKVHQPIQICGNI